MDAVEVWMQKMLAALGFDVSSLKPSTSIVEDLSADSLDLVETIMRVEKAF